MSEKRGSGEQESERTIRQRKRQRSHANNRGRRSCEEKERSEVSDCRREEEEKDATNAEFGKGSLK